MAHKKLAGATGLEPAASCVTCRRSNLCEAGCPDVRKNYHAKGVLFEETAVA
jgi:radical SAM protein with 4Fe4S-binding SPASM domain